MKIVLKPVKVGEPIKATSNCCNGCVAGKGGVGA